MSIKNSLWTIAGGAVPALSAVIAIPILIHTLGYELFAITSLLTSLTIFFFVYDFGLGRTVTYFISKVAHANKDDTIGTSIFCAVFLSLIATVVLYLSMPYVVEYWIKVRSEIAALAIQSLQITTLGILPNVVSNTLKGVLEGRSEFKLANICKIFSGSTIFLAPLLVVSLGDNSLIHISFAIVLSRFLTVLMYVFFIRATISFNWLQIKKGTLQTLYRYGSWVALSGFLSAMFVYGDRFIVARYLSPENLSLYVVSQDILNRYLLIPSSIAIVLMPIFSSGSLSKTTISKMYRQRQKYVFFSSLVVCMLIILMASIGHEVVLKFKIPLIVSDIVTIQAVGIFFCSMTQLPLIYLYTCGRPYIITMIYGLEALVYIGLAPSIFSHYNVLGACFVWSSRFVLEYFLMQFFAKKLMNRSQSS